MAKSNPFFSLQGVPRTSGLFPLTHAKSSIHSTLPSFKPSIPRRALVNFSMSDPVVSASSVTGFQHEALPEKTWIRLIKVFPYDQNGRIYCSLQQYDSESSSCPEYVALSYLWGDATPKHTIYVNGSERAIHGNLWDFLHRVQLNQSKEYYWTDLLCIDQAHHNERNEQVARMGDVYTQACHVVSWLGESPRGVEALRTLSKLGGEDSRYYPKGIDSILDDKERLDCALSQIQCQKYWSRVWVFQEVVCATKCFIMFGSTKVDFDEVLQQIKRAVHRFYPSDIWLKSADHLTRHWMHTLGDLRTHVQTEKRMEFGDLILKLSSCECTRDVDRVYGLLGLASRLDDNFDSANMEVDYNKTSSEVLWDMIFVVTESSSRAGLQRFFEALPGFFKSLSKLSKRVLFCSGGHIDAEDEPKSTGTDIIEHSWSKGDLLTALESRATTTTPHRWRNRARTTWQTYRSTRFMRLDLLRHAAQILPRTEHVLEELQSFPSSISDALMGLILNELHEHIDTPSGALSGSLSSEWKSSRVLCAAHGSDQTSGGQLLPIYCRSMSFVGTMERPTDTMLSASCEVASPTEACDYSSVTIEMTDTGLTLTCRREVQDARSGDRLKWKTLSETWDCKLGLQL